MSYYLQPTLLAQVAEASLPLRRPLASIQSAAVGTLGQTQHAGASQGATGLGAVAISTITAST
jgi:hypothetical protein